MAVTRNYIMAQVRLLKNLHEQTERLQKAISTELNLSSETALAVQLATDFNIENLMGVLEKAGVLDSMPDGEEVKFPRLWLEAASGSRMTLICPVNGGELTASVDMAGSDATWAKIYHRALPLDAEVDLAVAEVKTGGLAEENELPSDNKDIDLYICGDVSSDEPTDVIRISYEDIVKAWS